MSVLRVLLATVVAALCGVSPALADITRGCSASIAVSVIHSPAPDGPLGSIEGRGSCANKAHANDCRARARAAIDKCRADLWKGRQVNAIPASCNSLVRGSSRPGAKLTYEGVLAYGEPNRLMARAAHTVCCRLLPTADKVTIQIGGRIVGDRKCAATKVGKDRYQDEFAFPRYDMSCKAWRAKGVCGH